MGACRDSPHPERGRSSFLGAGLTASGVQYGDGYEATWELRAAENWMTERVSVNVEGDGWGRSLELFRSEQGVWSAETNEEGAQPEDLPSPVSSSQPT